VVGGVLHLSVTRDVNQLWLELVLRHFHSHGQSQLGLYSIIVEKAMGYLD